MKSWANITSPELLASKLSDFDYELPEELIAQTPPPERDGARMLVIDRATESWQDLQFRDFPSFLHAGDCLVLNNSRVIPSRLFGATETGAQVEIFLLRALPDLCWEALVKPGRKLLAGKVVHLGDNLWAQVIEVGERGERVLAFAGAASEDDLTAQLEALGHIPLPPYIHRDDNAVDRQRYQTVFAETRGSVAAPTAGLHFTSKMLDDVRDQGAEIARVTLHVGLGTFQPIDREDFQNHRLHHERYEVSASSWEKISVARRVIGVGTTSVRTIESVALSRQLKGETDLFLFPGSRFQKTGAMLTNFHLPKSSLLLLVCAFAGTELMLRAYRHAVETRYRFFSYGDCMLIL